MESVEKNILDNAEIIVVKDDLSSITKINIDDGERKIELYLNVDDLKTFKEML